MIYDSRFSAAGEDALKQRRVGALAAILVLLALLGGLALASPEARAPEGAAAAASAVPSGATLADQVAAPAGIAYPAMDCSTLQADPRDCIYY